MGGGSGDEQRGFAGVPQSGHGRGLGEGKEPGDHVQPGPDVFSEALKMLGIICPFPSRLDALRRAHVVGDRTRLAVHSSRSTVVGDWCALWTENPVASPSAATVATAAAIR